MEPCKSVGAHWLPSPLPPRRSQWCPAERRGGAGPRAAPRPIGRRWRPAAGSPLGGAEGKQAALGVAWRGLLAWELRAGAERQRGARLGAAPSRHARPRSRPAAGEPAVLRRPRGVWRLDAARCGAARGGGGAYEWRGPRGVNGGGRARARARAREGEGVNEEEEGGEEFMNGARGAAWERARLRPRGAEQRHGRWGAGERCGAGTGPLPPRVMSRLFL